MKNNIFLYKINMYLYRSFLCTYHKIENGTIVNYKFFAYNSLKIKIIHIRLSQKKKTQNVNYLI